jgi:D-amino-acid dehydrogenase
MHVVVIGGGVIGLTQAYELALRGVEVTVLEARGAQTSGQGASAVNAGWIVPAMASPVPAPGLILQALRWMLRPDSPLFIRPSLDPGFLRFLLGMWRHSTDRHFRAGFEAQLRLAGATTELFQAYRDDGIAFELHRDGVLLVYLSRDKLDHQRHHLDLPASFGLDPEVLLGDAVRDREPALSDAVVGGVAFPREWHLDPVSFVAGLAARCAQLGVRLVTSAPVERLERRGGVATAAVCEEERYPADAFVLAAGIWTRPLSAGLGVPLPIHAGKGYAIDLTPPPIRLRSMVALGEAKVAMTPLSARLRLAGTMEFGHLDERINEVRVAAIRRAPGAYLRDWQVPDAQTPQTVGAGARPMTPDGLPVIGRLAPYANVHVSSGHGMMGVTLAPATARALTAVVLGGATPDELRPFAPQRFGRRAATKAAKGTDATTPARTRP